MLKDYIRLIRVKQWVKNAFVLVPLFSLFRFTEVESVLVAFYVSFAFSFAAGAHYILNDTRDRKKDALPPAEKEPTSRERCHLCAQGIVLLLSATVGCIYLTHSVKVVVAIALYLVINVYYSGKLKDIVLPDVFVIAVGFVLCLYTGTYTIRTTVSSYIFMTTLCLALFLGFTKREGELLRHGTVSLSVLKEFLTSTYTGGGGRPTAYETL